jgi:hypothetical protein
VDPVPDPLLLRKSSSADNRTRTSGSVAWNCDHESTEAVPILVGKLTLLVRLYEADVVSVL